MFRSFRYVYDILIDGFRTINFCSKNISNLQGICVKSKQDPKTWNFLLEVTLEGNSDEEIKNNLALIGLAKK